MNWLRHVMDAITTWWWNVRNGPYVDSSYPAPDSSPPSDLQCPNTKWLDDAD